ncbi:MAG: S1 RNA-binding domain-containing protein [Candidatus Melainabacteria bacterium]|nr:MAG: S1 RNA-binding domain-containing protein [Candidatus Melainabacteria bacterium]
MNMIINFKKGDLVKGTVVGYDPDNVIVDIGAKTNALVPNREAVVEAGDDIKETLKKVNNTNF